MANCKRCHVKVGCGCQLINGYCSPCNYAIKQEEEIKQQQDANTKAN